MFTSIVIACAWAGLGFAMAAGIFAAFGAFVHILALAECVVRGLQHECAVDDRRNANHLLVAAGICALIAAAVGGLATFLGHSQ